MSPSASDVMIQRYDIEDVERYKADHKYLWVGAAYCGVALAGYAAAGAIVISHDVEGVTLGLLMGATLSWILSALCAALLKRGAR